MSPWALNRFAHAVSQGAVFGYPTDTIWGFGCHPLIASSVARILRIKRRSPDKGLILLSSKIDYCMNYVGLDSEQLEPVQRATDHPITWLVPASEACPNGRDQNHQSPFSRVFMRAPAGAHSLDQRQSQR
jgi:L-threonylcarbamoyladenylate synthase